MALDGNATFPFQIHIIKDLCGSHLGAVKGVGYFQQAISQCGFSMINMCDNAEVPEATNFCTGQCHKISVRF